MCRVYDEVEGLVVAVSDGAGSASHAELGARTASERLCELAASDLQRAVTIDEVLVRAWVEEVRATLIRQADTLGLPVSALHCTLLGAVLTPDVSVFVQIGDGIIVVPDGEGTWCWAHWPQRGEFVNTTSFVTEEASHARAAVSVGAGEVREVALLSDGIEPLVVHYATRAVHGPFFERMFEPVRRSEGVGEDVALSESLATWLGSPAVCARTDDDKTLILATRRARVPA